jgi:acyl-CoA-dependent ceramide synthase
LYRSYYLDVPTIYFALTGLGHYVLGLPIFTPFYTLQYAVKVNDTTTTSSFVYGCGWRDIPLLISLFFGWTLVRAIAMHRVLRPWAFKRGVHNHNKLDRFAEQSWQAAFYLMTWLSSTYLILSNPDWLDGKTSWQNFPYSHISMQAKLHCLGILMFWTLQLITVHTEQRRKDHNAMIVHHVITITLIAGCYVVYATPFVLVIAWCMDLADVFLSVSNTLAFIIDDTILTKSRRPNLPIMSNAIVLPIYFLSCLR